MGWNNVQCGVVGARCGVHGRDACLLRNSLVFTTSGAQLEYVREFLFVTHTSHRGQYNIFKKYRVA